MYIRLETLPEVSAPETRPPPDSLLVAGLAALQPRAADAGAWTVGKGNLWSKVTVLSQTTDEHSDGEGSSVAMPLDARCQTRQVYFDMFYGIRDGIDLGLQIPLVSNKSVDKDEGNDVATPPPALETESGLSDLRGYGKVRLPDQSRTVGTLKLGFKIPIGEYRPVPEALSVTDGQWDLEVVGHIGVHRGGPELSYTGSLFE